MCVCVSKTSQILCKNALHVLSVVPQFWRGFWSGSCWWVFSLWQWDVLCHYLKCCLGLFIKDGLKCMVLYYWSYNTLKTSHEEGNSNRASVQVCDVDNHTGFWPKQKGICLCLWNGVRPAVCGGNLNTGVFLETMELRTVRVCLMITSIELFIPTPISGTLTKLSANVVWQRWNWKLCFLTRSYPIKFRP